MDRCLDGVTRCIGVCKDMIFCVRLTCLDSTMCDGVIALRLW